MHKISVKLQLLLALLLLPAGILIAGSPAAAAVSLTVGLSSTAPNIGKVASGSAVTTFTVAANFGGAVGISTGSGMGSFVPPTASRSAPIKVIISCSGSTKCSNDTSITITTAAPPSSGAGNQINGLSVGFDPVGTVGAAQYKSGSTSGGTSMTFTIKGVGNNASGYFWLGVAWPIKAGGSGAATGPYGITATIPSVATGSGSASAQATVDAPITISNLQNLNFGKIVIVQANTAGSVTWAASGQGSMSYPYWSTTNARQVANGSGTIGKFKVTGTPSQQIQVSISPNPLGMTGGTSPLNVTFSNTATGIQLIGTDGTFTFYVGGTFSWTAATVPSPAHYQGTMGITVNYN